MKTSDAIRLSMALNAVLSRQERAPAKFGYAVAINARRLAHVAEAFESSRRALIEQFGKRGDDGQLVTDNETVQLSDPGAFNAAMSDLVAVDVNVDLHTVPIDEFPDELPPALISDLLPIVTA